MNKEFLQDNEPARKSQTAMNKFCETEKKV